MVMRTWKIQQKYNMECMEFETNHTCFGDGFSTEIQVDIFMLSAFVRLRFLGFLLEEKARHTSLQVISSVQGLGFRL